jgi:3-hydroxyacyl-CoA dehydrogenase/enoyl-CoA hydratase/3-hydroxybutyryl-CoA epimerase
MPHEEEVILTFSEDSRLATISLGRPDERTITITPERLRSFVTALERVREAKPIGLVIRAPSSDSFCVGADISLIQSVTDPEKGAALAREGQLAFNLLHDLPLTTVAAIGGACVGGGCELVLACDYRIATDAQSTAIGLPETKLGILPGFGGTYRLPRLIGLPKALDVILAGKTLRANQALKSGLVDKVVPATELYSTADALALGELRINRKKRSLSDRLLTSTALGRAIVMRSAKKATLKQTKGAYPAPLRALTVTAKGLAKRRGEALAIEARELGRLIVTPESKALVHIYYLTEASKGLGRGYRDKIAGVHTMVIGAGTMGAGIATALAKSKHQVIVKDTTDSALERGKAQVLKDLSRLKHLSSYERIAIANRIDWIQFNSQTVARSSVVIEAVFEDIALKSRIFSELARQVPAHTVLASNTSSLSVSEMAKGIEHPERFVGMHFFNPVDRMPLVEIIRGEQTSQDTIERVAALAIELGKFPIVVNDVPGFLVNRILVPYLNEATYLLQEGYTVEQIDRASLSFGMPMGPLRLLDEVGLDVAAHVSQVMYNAYGERMAAPDFASRLLKLGRKGRKGGAGFYDYLGNGKEVAWKGLQEALCLPDAVSNIGDVAELSDRLVLHLVNEAFKCLSEGVAGVEPELARKQIDLGTVMGIGFPPFRGGVLYYAQQRGVEEIRGRLKRYSDSFGSRYDVW